MGDSRLTRCRFERLKVESASFGTGLRPTVYTECSFDGSRLGGTGWGRARFVRCSFRNVRLRGLFGFDAEFVDCVFTGRAEHCVFNGAPNADLDQVRELATGWPTCRRQRAALQRRIDEAPPDRTANEFRGNDFSGMELIDVDFRDGIDLTAQRFPPGDEYAIVLDASAAIARARARSASGTTTRVASSAWRCCGDWRRRSTTARSSCICGVPTGARTTRPAPCSTCSRGASVVMR